MFELVIIVLLILLLLSSSYWYLNNPYYLSSYLEESYSKSNNSNNQVYNIHFVTPWGSDNTIAHPPNPHTGVMFLTNHDNQFDLFRVGQYASKGIGNTSVFGTVDDLVAETKNNPHIGNIVTSPVVMAPGQSDMKIMVGMNKPFLSFSTMIAPSSDWFTGFSSLNLFANGKWLNKVTLPLYPYVSGVNARQGFIQVNQYVPKQNPDPIRPKIDRFMYPSGNVKPIAYVTITRDI